MTIFVPGQFHNEVAKVLQRYSAVDQMLQRGDVDSADIYMSQVLEADGRRIYDAVLSMVAAAKGIPPKDVPR